MGSSDVRVTVERRMANVDDQNLGWEPVMGFPPVVLSKSFSGDDFTWTATVQMPPGSELKRLVIEEYETHDTGDLNVFGSTETAERVVYLDIR